MTEEDLRSMLSEATSAPPPQQVELLGRVIDTAGDLGMQSVLLLAAEACDRLPRHAEHDWCAAALLFYQGNAWSSLRHLQHVDLDTAWDWESPLHGKEILALRRCIQHAGFARLQPESRARVFTNLANVLSNTGRVVDALELFDRALEQVPGFGMAMGNRAVTLLAYAKMFYEPSHRCIFAGTAEGLLRSALKQDLESGRSGFESHLKFAVAHQCGANCAAIGSLMRHPVGATDEERSYRQWCLDHRLFLNPLNDLGPIAAGARDFLHLPSLTATAADAVGMHGFYNQLKQEFITARWLYWDATRLSQPAFVDAECCLVDTGDAPLYGASVDKVRLSLRTGYSLFDKVGGFLRKALGVSDDPRKRYFRWMWYSDPKNTVLRKEFAGRRNLALRGLFWLSKDLVADRKDTTRQDAAERQLHLPIDDNYIAPF